MNTNDKHSSTSSKNEQSGSVIRSDASSNDASSGKSGATREPQRGSAIDNSVKKGDGPRDASRSEGTAKR